MPEQFNIEEIAGQLTPEVIQAATEAVAKQQLEVWKAWVSAVLEAEPNLEPERRERWEKLCSTEWKDLPAEDRAQFRDFATRAIGAFMQVMVRTVKGVGDA